MGTRSSDPRNTTIQFRVSEKEKDRIEADARSVGLTPSEYARTCALSGMGSTPAAVAASYVTTESAPRTASMLRGLADAITQGQEVLGGREKTDGNDD